MRIEDAQLKAFIVDGNLIPPKEVDAAEKEAAQSKKRLADIIRAKNLLSEEDLLKLEAYILGIPFINLEGEEIPPDILRIIPEPIAKKHNIIAYRKEKGTLEVAMLDPEDLQTIDFIRRTVRLKLLPRLTTVASIKHVLRQYQKSLEAEFGDIIREEAGGVKATSEFAGQEGEEGDLKQAAEELPIVRIVDTLLKHAVLQNAMTLPKQVHSGVVARIKILSNLKIDEHRLPQDGRFKLETDEYKYSLRVSILPVYDGEKIVMRLLPETSKALTLDALGFRGEALEHVYQALRKPVGMLLVTGPTGSGKTTTLYSMVDILNTPNVNISTVEDPVEYRMQRINQTQIRPDIGLTFANGLRSLVRQDPNIIMVGEIRDKETADLAVNASLTGHLVLSTLHTNSAAGALPRLIDMGVEPFLIASTVNVIIAQRLVRVLYAKGKKEQALSKDKIEQLSKVVDLERILKFLKAEKIISEKAKIEDVPFYTTEPSPDAPDGYQGRIGIHEVMTVSQTVKELIMKNANSDEIEKEAKRAGMMTMLEDGIRI